MVLIWRDRFGALLGNIRALATDYQAATDGTDELTVLTTDNLQKGQRVIWRDKNPRVAGTVHEMIVSSTRTVHDARGKALVEAKCINSVAELYWSDVPKPTDPTQSPYSPYYLPDRFDQQGNPIQRGYHLQYLVEHVLSDTRWEWCNAGTYEAADVIPYVGMRELYDTSVREVIAAAVAGYNGAELYTYVFADEHGVVTHRYLSISRPLEASTADDVDVKGRFTYAKNTANVTRDVGDAEVYTAVRCIGGDILNAQGEVVGQNVIYLEANDTIKNQWGRPMADGTVGHSVYTMTSNLEGDQLLQYAAETLDKITTPDVTYTIQLDDASDLQIRDVVDVLDEDLNMRMRARITSVKRDLLDEKSQGVVTIGRPVNYGAVAMSYQTNNAVTAASESNGHQTNRDVNYGSGSTSESSRLSSAETQIDSLNDRINQGGGASWPLIADKSWWNDDDSFCFFNKDHTAAITGKDDTVGCWSMNNGLTPDPQSQSWNEGDMVWSARNNSTDNNLGVKTFMSSPNIAALRVGFVQSPTSSSDYLYLKEIAGGLLAANGGKGLGFFESSHTASGGTEANPFLRIYSNGRGTNNNRCAYLQGLTEVSGSTLSVSRIMLSPTSIDLQCHTGTSSNLQMTGRIQISNTGTFSVEVTPDPAHHVYHSLGINSSGKLLFDGNEVMTRT